MEEGTLLVLAGTAAFIGFFHTVTGPDHYVPFVAMSRVGRWSLAKTVAITLACGVGHVLSSVVLGIMGIALGVAVGKLAWFEGIRGNVAGWLLLGLGLAYLVWGVRRAVRNKPHTHRHDHVDGTAHSHEHVHRLEHTHVHAGESGDTSMTPWILFTIFVFGPCEPLIPILMYPAAKLSMGGIVLVTLVFGICTLGTMLAIVTVGYLGLTFISLEPLERYSHVVAGLAVVACGVLIQFGF